MNHHLIVIVNIFFEVVSSFFLHLDDHEESDSSKGTWKSKKLSRELRYI
jgi:hypothetical protein